ncbi:serine/threonine-protein kinase [Streptomyces sp. IB201691-2A2]|uniref:serine/threonine-protein kinase n=1 Tax=Streptomyces sp. IB201691-2A2 TaxID=2561920 RepID=UPI00117F6035|nr:serine/threonine-protein kinase [Streptomyces sp. IB201691-2A2]TRO62816.1 serine/threonine protein kinase [Streptomyces sp. IB201691-2A2]
MSEAERTGASRQDESDRLLAGRYRLGGVLGRGGMGTVWRAKDETLGRTVAVKELRLPARIDEDEKRRLITRTFREAKAIARIRNNGAVTVFDVIDEDNRPWIVMELVEGKSLAEVIREDGLLTPKRAAEVGLAILDVLRSAHREGILHRDVKPSNVLIAEDGRVVLTDFGIAQVEGDPSITSTGMLVGAPSYISPERARGHKPGPAADLWSLGGLLYASVEGVPPYDKGSAIATLTAVMTEPMEQPKNAGPLEKVIYGLLVKDPEQRLDDAGARAMLTEVLHAPEPKEDEPEPADATKVVPLPELPVDDAPAKKKSSGGKAAGGSKKGEEPVERLRGALRSVRKGKGAAAAAGAAAVAGARKAGAGKAGAGKAADTEAPAAPEGADGKAAKASTSASASAAPEASPSPSASASTPSSPAAPAPASAASDSAAEAAPRSASADSAGSAKGRDSAASVVNFSSVGGSSGGAGDTHPRTAAPRASLTDVVPRRTLMIVAVVVVLAVLGTILAVTLSGGDDSSAKENKGGDDKSVSSGASAGSDTKQDEKSGTEKDSGEKTDSAGGGANTGSSPSASASGETGGSKDDSGSGSGDGAAETYKSGQGFSIGLPKGWKYESTSAAGSRFAGPDGQKLLVGWTTTPKSDPVADWKNQEQFMQRPQYKRIRIEKVDYRGWNTADWEFTYVDGGTQYRSIDRGFVVNDGLGYGLMYTAKGSKWDTELRKNTWRTLTKSFEPKS